MNFKLKALVASLALVAALPAGAAMTTSTSGDSSLILSLLDASGGISATFDLGYSKSTFNTSASNSWNLTTGDYSSAWAAFTAAGSVANAQYAVFAGDKLGSGVGAQSLFTTGAGTVTAVSTSTLTTMLNAFDTYISANNVFTNHSTRPNGASSITSAGVDAVNASETYTNTVAYAGNGAAYGGNGGKIANFGADTNGAVGADLYVWNLLSGANGVANTSVTKLSVAGFNPFFTLTSDGFLTYTAVAAVPEADTSAMMLAGLGLMGFIARRRKSV